MEVKKDILWRVYLCLIGMICFAVMVVGKAFYIQKVEGKYWRGLSDSLHQKIVELAPERGTIYSEDGNMLSTSIPFFDIRIDFGAEGLRAKDGKLFKENIEDLSAGLSALFNDKSKEEYKRMLTRGFIENERYFLFKRNINFDQYKKLRQLPLVKMGKNKSGFIAEVKTKRLNPYKLLANRTIGLARENAQNVGLEQTYEEYLRGTSGKRLVRYVAGGAFVPIEGYEIEPENGKDIITTLDVTIQDIAENALMRMMVSNDAVHGTCIVMEVATGKIKAIANLGRQTDGSYWEDYNYAIMASEPGSTFKLATMLSVIDDKYVTINDKININRGVYQFGNRTMYDSERHSREEVTIKQAFALSSNVGMSRLVHNFYSANPEKYINHLRNLNFDKRAGIDLTGESAPIIKSPKSKTWSKTTLPWTSVGYEVLVSPLQTLMLYNAVANNGKMMKPYLVNAVMDYGIVVKEIKPVIINDKICSDETVKQLREALESVVTEGTAKSLQSELYGIAGKTGTALVANGNRGYADKIYLSSFAGYFPADNPKFSCIVVIKNKAHAAKFYGGSVAGPVFREVADKLYGLYISGAQSFYAYQNSDSAKYKVMAFQKDASELSGLIAKDGFKESKDDKWVSLEKDANKVKAAGIRMPENVMPDLFGLGLKDALYLVENMGMAVDINGKGKVVAQSLPTGTPIRRGQTLQINLN